MRRHRDDPLLTLCADRLDGVHLPGRVSRRGCGGAGLGEDLHADVAAGFGPFVVLPHEHGAGEADDRGPVGEDAGHVGAAAQFPVQPFLRAEDQSWRQISRGTAVKASRSSRAAARCAAAAGSLPSSASTTRSNWAATSAASGWSKMVRTRVATQGWLVLLIFVRRSRR